MNSTNATPAVKKLIKFDRAVSTLKWSYRTSNFEIVNMIKLFSEDIYQLRQRLRLVRATATAEYLREYLHFVHIPEVRFLRATVKTTMRELFYRSKGDRAQTPKALQPAPEYFEVGWKLPTSVLIDSNRYAKVN